MPPPPTFQPQTAAPQTVPPQTAAPVATTMATFPSVSRYRQPPPQRYQPQPNRPVRPPPTTLPKAGQPQPAWLSRTKARLRSRQLGRGRAVVPISDMFNTPKKPAFENGDSFRLRRRRN